MSNHCGMLCFKGLILWVNTNSKSAADVRTRSVGFVLVSLLLSCNKYWPIGDKDYKKVIRYGLKCNGWLNYPPFIISAFILYALNVAMAFAFLSSLYGDFMKVSHDRLFFIECFPAGIYLLKVNNRNTR